MPAPPCRRPRRAWRDTIRYAPRPVPYRSYCLLISSMTRLRQQAKVAAGDSSPHWRRHVATPATVQSPEVAAAAILHPANIPRFSRAVLQRRQRAPWQIHARRGRAPGLPQGIDCAAGRRHDCHALHGVTPALVSLPARYRLARVSPQARETTS